MKPLILITNDDGVFAPGIKAAAEAVADLGEILIVAPRFEQSGAGHSYPKNENNGIIEEIEIEINGKKHIAYGVHGSPAQAVTYAVHEIAERMPDLCISGINNGENIGRNLTASGTVGAALSSSNYDIPSIAVSQEKYATNKQQTEASEIDWKVSKYFVRMFAEKILKEGMQEGVALYNINVPSTATKDTEYRWTIQSKDRYLGIKPMSIREDRNKPFFYKLAMCTDINNLETNSDVYAIVVDKIVSVTPLGWDLSLKLK